jgi:hypothetical protein
MMFIKNQPLVETKLMLEGEYGSFCQASETEGIEIVVDESKTFEVKKTTYAVATLKDDIYLVDVKEIDKSHIEHIDLKPSQKDLPIYVVSLVGRVQLHGYNP